MRATIVSCVFTPEPVTSAVTSETLAKALSERGYDVTVIASFPSQPQGSLYPGYSRRLWRRERRSGSFNIVRCFSTLSRRSSLLSRFAENISFGLTSGLALLVSPRPSFIYANTWPLFATGLLVLIAWLRRIPIVVSVQDLYPESLVIQNRLAPQSFAVRLLRHADQQIAAHATALLVAAQAFARIYRDSRGIPERRIHFAPNWISASAVECSLSSEDCRRGFGIREDALVYGYSGNIGAAAGLVRVVELFIARNDLREALFIAGAGSQLAECQRLCHESGCNNVVIHTPYPQGETARALKAADVLLLPTHAEQGLVSLPSKLIWYMLAGRPILAITCPGSEAAKIIELAECGWVVDSPQPEDLDSALQSIASMPRAELLRIGKNGRKYALEHFTDAACLPRLCSLLSESGA